MKFSSLPRIYYENKITSNLVELSSANTHHVKNVLRLKDGSTVRLFNQYDGEFIAHIELLNNKKNVRLSIDKKIRDVSANLNLTLAIGITKNDAMAASLSIAAQLCVNGIIPVKTARTQRGQINNARYKKILLDATRQSEGFIPPQLHGATTLAGLLSQFKENTIIFANENEDNLRIKDIGGKVVKGSSIILLIGPEGGFTDQEIEMLSQESNVTSVSLGERVLKVETACACAIAQLQSYF